MALLFFLVSTPFLSSDSTSFAVSSAESTNRTPLPMKLNYFLNQWIVCATENQGVDTALLETTQVSLDRHLHHVIIRPSLLHQGYEERTSTTINLNPGISLFQRPRISTALDGCLGPDNANF